VSATTFPLAVLATVVAWAPPTAFGVLWPAYSPVRDYISELGAQGAPYAAAVNASFLAAGVLFVTTCLALSRRQSASRTGLLLVSAIGWSYVVAAFARCDAGCPAEGSATQAVHNTVGALGYLLGGIGLLRVAGPLAKNHQDSAAVLARVAGLTALAGLIAMAAPELGDVRGLVQRVVEFGVFAWLLVAARPTSVS
jgi:hypothetical membrane protein